MGWADSYIEKLKQGLTVQFRPKGHSMTGRVDHGQLVTVLPVVMPEMLVEDAIVLCTVRGSQYLHLIKARRNESQYLIGNNRGGINGWTNLDRIYGIVSQVEP